MNWNRAMHPLHINSDKLLKCDGTAVLAKHGGDSASNLLIILLVEYIFR